MIIYSIYGGIPYYLELLDDGLNPVEKSLTHTDLCPYESG